MPNPSGVNGFEPHPPEVPYGEKQQNAAVQASAPLAGQQETARATNAPRRAQRSAARGGPQEAAHVAEPQMPGSPGQIAPQAQVALFWQQVAAILAAHGVNDPILSPYAEEAAGGSTNLSAA